MNILKQGAEVWNEWREREFYVRPQLRDADFREIDIAQINLWESDLTGANFSGKDLSGRDLTDTNLTGARFNGANLRTARLVAANLYLADLIGANLFGADLQATDFRYANLNNADLRETYLGGANFTGATLDKARFDKSSFNGTIFGDNDLSVVTGLELVSHGGPSVIGIDTLYRSGGSIAEGFLRGCGVPDEFITYLPSLIGAQQAIQFYSCFISYSHKDEAFAKRLHSRMREANLRVWFAPEDVKGGQKLHEQIDRAIHTYDRLLLILSKDSLESEWVLTEIRKARKIEDREKRTKLFPIRLVDMEFIRDWECFDVDTGKDLAMEVRKYYIPDFSAWKDHDLFEKAFERLLGDLKAGELGLETST